MPSRGFELHMSATMHRGLTLAWAALFALSMLFTYAASAAPVRATEPGEDCDDVPHDIGLILDTSGSLNEIDDDDSDSNPGCGNPDLNVTKSVDKTVADPGDTLNYRIQIDNVGNASATGVNVTDDLSGVLAFGTFNGPASPVQTSFVGGVLTWTNLTVTTTGLTITFSVTLHDSGIPAGIHHLGNTVVVDGPGSNCAPVVPGPLHVVPPVLSCSTDTTLTVSVLDIQKFAIGGDGTFVFEVAACLDGASCTVLGAPYVVPVGTVVGSGGFELLLKAGWYTVSEATQSGWTPSGVICHGAPDTNKIEVLSGQTVGCTFTNTRDTERPLQVQPQSPPSLVVDKTYTGNSGGEANGVKLSKSGDVLTFSLPYTIVNPPVTGGIITDVLPVGLDYVAGSATGNGVFTFAGYDAGTRTLTWNAPVVLANGSVTYQTKVTATGSATIDNVTTIDSAQTAPDQGKDTVHLQEVLAETGRPSITLPPTDSIHSGDQTSSNPGFGLALALLAIAGIGLVTGTLVARTSRLRREEARRR